MFALTQTLFLRLMMALCLLLSLPLLADSVWLKNGDKVSGTLVIKVSDKVVIKTPYAGEVKINWVDIHSITSSQTIKMMLTDGSIIEGKLLHVDEGQQILDPETNAPLITTELSEIKYVNPSKDLTGEGYVWSGNLNLGSTFNYGNSNNRNIQFNGESILRGLDHRYTVQGYSYWAEVNGEETQNNSRVRGQLDHFFSTQWYGYANTILENDYFRDLKLRSHWGAGSGYQIFESEKRNLSVEGGLAWIHQDFYQDADENHTAIRWAINYNQYLFDSFVQAFHRHEVIYTARAPSQMLIYSQTGLRFPFILGLNATTQLDYNHDSRPVDERKKGDARALFTLGFSWK